MIDIIYSIIAGIVQGLTEFLPVSSSGHLVVLHDFLKFDFIDNLAFDVVLHLGTLFALVIFFWSDILKYLRAFFQSLAKWNLRNDVNQRLAWYILIATFPAAIAGYFFENGIELFFRQTSLVAAMLIVVGVLLYLADRFSARIKTIDQLSFSSSLLIGIAQAIALIPGVSRSGITIIAGLTQKLNRESAARFSFLLSIPIVFGAGAKKVFDLFTSQSISSSDVVVLILGFLSSVIVGYFCIKYFLRFLQSHSLSVFVYYRIVLGLLIFTLLFLDK